MNANDFYREIEHTPVPWRQYTLHVPVFYPEITLMTVSLLAPIEKINAILPSKRLKPYRITPWHSTLTITAYRYQDSDLGPYNEVGIAVPVTIDKQTPLFTGSLRRMPEKPMSYVHHLPVTTEIAREVGADFAGYPKFIADIEFSEDDSWLTCDLSTGGQSILTLSGRKLELRPFPRFYMSPLTYRGDTILRSDFVVSEREMGTSGGGEDVKLELGTHPIADELKAMQPGRAVSYSYVPRAQGLLTPVIESFAG